MKDDTEKAFQKFYELMWRDHGNGFGTVFEKMIAEMQEYDERYGKFQDIPTLNNAGSPCRSVLDDIIATEDYLNDDGRV